MRTHFKILADKFSVLNEQDNKEFITFYEANRNEIAGLTDFETDEELYLSAVINHTYGRSLLYQKKDHDNAQKHLDIARSLILKHKDEFEIELKEDIWYLQTLQHLLKASLERKDYKRAKSLIQELKIIDIENIARYCLKETEITRIGKHAVFVRLTYGGVALLASSVAYGFLNNITFGYIDSIGVVATLVGLVGQFCYRGSTKQTTE